MQPKTKEARWWQLYAMLPVLGVLFLIELRLGLRGTQNTIAQLAILALAYSLIHLWIWTNRSGSRDAEEMNVKLHLERDRSSAVGLASDHQAPKRLRSRPIMQLPPGGVKGLLDVTFQLDDQSILSDENGQQK
ncbi:MAG TPA: hypothetical protein VMJ64_07585 [Anaerolineales bacterium]|nr:hypothetical protein [Anaerolineales bacterium]